MLLQNGTQSLQLDLSSSQYMELDLSSVPDHLCMTNPSTTNCPNGLTLNVYLRIQNLVDGTGVITTIKDDSGTYKSGINVIGRDPSLLR